MLFHPNNKAIHLKATDDLSGVCQVGQPIIITAYARDNLTLPLTETGGGGGNRSCVKKIMGGIAIWWPKESKMIERTSID